MSDLNTKTVQNLIARALEIAQADFKRPICVSICDAYGFMLAFARMDGAPIRSIAISEGKAYTAARIGTNTDAFLERLNRENMPASYFCDPKLTGMAGGAVLKDAGGKIIGAVGVSGLAPSEDQAITNAIAAIVAAA